MKYDLEYVLNSALDGIFIVANDNRLVLFNRACKELFGFSAEEVVDKACLMLSELESTCTGLRESGKKIPYGELASHRERMVMTHKKDRKVWVEIIYTPIYDQENGEIAYVMGVIKDISEQKQLEEEKRQILQQLDTIRHELESKYNFTNIIGRSQGILNALKLTAEVARQNTTVMIMGESGTGKELLAKAIHFNSQRSSQPFVPINCSAFPDTLIESELFGYEKGAFTGAEKSKPGKVHLASGGTLFLDEVTELSPPAQAKILRLLQEREFEPLGSVKILHADLRIIAATNKDIKDLVRTGKFREDLYYRLFVYPITLPSLRDRTEDLPVLCETFIKKMNRDLGKNIRGFTPEAIAVASHYSWPGNIRELQNVIERLMILSKKEWIDVSDLPLYLREETGQYSLADYNIQGTLPKWFSLGKYLHECESKLILNALKKCDFNKTRAARVLGLTRSTFRYKLSKVPVEKV